LSGEKHALGFCSSVEASLLAMAACQPTTLYPNASSPCGSWLASDGGLPDVLILWSCRRLRSFDLWQQH
jgi:hypothetical protein